MIYLVTTEMSLFDNEAYKTITVKESLDLMKDWKIIQLDSETSGRNAHLCDFLCVQLGNDKADARVVIDTATIDIKLYKDLIEKALIVGHNLKFDLQFLYNYHIIPRRIYDTMIVENLLYLGYPHISMSAEEYDKWEYTFPYHSSVDAYGNETKSLSYALDAVAEKRLGIHLDKSVRGEIIWRGLDTKVINYSALDVTYLEKIMHSQIEDLKRQGLMEAAKLECNFVPAIAYLEWSGIHLDQDKWRAKMKSDQDNLNAAKKALDQWVIKAAGKSEKPLGEQRNIYEPVNGDGTGGDKIYEELRDFVYIDTQGGLFDGYNLVPQVDINWSSSKQVIAVAKILGFNTIVQDKKTGENKDSVLEKHLASQSGVCDEFLKLYFNYQEYTKVCSSFGQGHLNAINPKTGRIHTVYKQLGAASGRMSCGSQQPDTDLAKEKHINPSDCTSPNIQQLPHDEITRACFTAMPGNLWVSCDYSAQEGRVQGDIYQDEAILKMYREGIDGHSMYAKIFFKDELKDIDVHDVKKLRPDLRTKAKSPEFALAYGAGYTTIMQQLKCTEEEAQTIIKNYEEGFKGTTEFARKGSAFVRKNGYILMNPLTGHKMYWYDHKKWLKRQESFTQDFWEEYRTVHKLAHDSIAQKVSMHFRAASKWDRLARNAPPQGTSACMTKEATTNIFNWIVDNDYFGVILLAALVHDETNWEFPESIKEFPSIVKKMMEESAAKYCKSIPIPAEASVGSHWIH